MHPKSLKWLNDILEACDLILSATADRALEHYAADRLLRSAIERNFELIGEALVRLRKNDPATAARVPECAAIIAFRNLLIHAYDFIDNNQVWKIIQADVPRLQTEITSILSHRDQSRPEEKEG